MPEKDNTAPPSQGFGLILLVGILFILVGLAGTGYCVYDVVSPVGSKEQGVGLQNVITILFVGMGVTGLLGGGVFMKSGRSQNDMGLAKVGAVLAVVSTVFILIIAWKGWSQRQRIERGLVLAAKTTDELVKIAVDENDVQALEIISARRNAVDIPVLEKLALDEKVSPDLRVHAVSAIKHIGVKESLSAIQRISAAKVVEQVKQAARDAVSEPQQRRRSEPEKSRGVEDF